MEDEVSTINTTIENLDFYSTGEVNDKVDAINTTINTLSSRVDDEVSTINTTIDNLSTALYTEISTTNGTVTDLSSHVEDEVLAIDGKIADHADQISGNTSSIDANAADIVDLRSDVGTYDVTQDKHRFWEDKSIVDVIGRRKGTRASNAPVFHKRKCVFGCQFANFNAGFQCLLIFCFAIYQVAPRLISGPVTQSSPS